MVDTKAPHYVDKRALALHVAEAFDPAMAMQFRRSIASPSSAIRMLSSGVPRVATDTGTAESKHHPAPAEPTLANITRSLSKSQRSIVLILDEAQDFEGFDADLTQPVISKPYRGSCGERLRRVAVVVESSSKPC